jgi:ABC-type multidrug transport system permease subunit
VSRGFAAAIGKDLRLLTRDRAGLVFLTVAPIVVITVAGFSLASLYGADPQGATAYVLPLVDEDRGAVGRAVAERLAGEPAVQVRRLANRDEAVALVRRHDAGTALIIPAGASKALLAGHRPVSLLLMTDPVKYLEVTNVRALVQELRHGIEIAALKRARRGLERARRHALAKRSRFEHAAADLRVRLAGLPAELAAARAETERRLAVARLHAERSLEIAAVTAAAERAAEARARLAVELAPLRSFLTETANGRQEFTAWLAMVRQKAGRLAERLPPPPTPPSIAPELAALVGADVDALIARVLPPTSKPMTLPPPPPIELPPLPTLPVVRVPSLPKPPAITLPGALEIEEASVTGAPRRLNTFDQNVPGFSVTFLLLGMLLGVSLGLLDERDWGTLERVRATPTPFATILVSKLVARFTIGFAQMVVLFAVGWVAFGVSLGPEPWALALPTMGIVFAGTAFGLVVAGLARSREAVLPLGSMVIVTMAAVGGCWWPIDLEPDWMRRAALAFPTTWAMAAYNDLMIRQQPLAAALRPTGVLLTYGILYLVVGLTLFRRQTTR